MGERYQKARPRSKTKRSIGILIRFGGIISRCLGPIAQKAAQQAMGRRVDTNIQMLRQQHDAAEEMASELIILVNSYRDAYDAIRIARLIGKLNVLLRVHFAYEDTVLYPVLMRSRDGEAAALARVFAAETGALASQFEEFARRWSGPTIIDAMFGRFRDEATALIAAFGARIERENDLLYPFAEKMTGARAA